MDLIHFCLCRNTSTPSLTPFFLFMLTVRLQEPTTRRPFSLVQLADLDALAAKAGAKVTGSLVASYHEGQEKYRERRERRCILALSRFVLCRVYFFLAVAAVFVWHGPVLAILHTCVVIFLRVRGFVVVVARPTLASNKQQECRVAEFHDFSHC